jgi:UDP-2-acetamido-3-amino-2,3-dideoxy-glucuronate N-acetyltransferase
MTHNFIDPSAILAPSVRVWHYARVLAGVRIGEDSSIGSGSEIGKNTIIGDRTRIGAGVFLPSNSLVGDEVFIGPNTTFCDDKYPRAGQTYEPRPPRIGDRASIGAGCVILPGVRIGAGAMIGAGSVVVGDVPENALLYGEPATIRRTLETYKNFLPLSSRASDPVTAQDQDQGQSQVNNHSHA